MATARKPKLKLSGLQACMEDVRDAARDRTSAPNLPPTYAARLAKLEAARSSLPPLYQDSAYLPFLERFRGLGAAGYADVRRRDPTGEGLAGMMDDITAAILQNKDGFQSAATDAFQEVVSDLFDGFLSAEDRAGVKPPDFETIAPLVKWGNPAWGPYTWTATATESFGMDVAVVNLPPVNATRGLMAWSTLGHETGGHDILHADEGLLAELSESVRDELQASSLPAGLAEYWASRIDETASDVLGVLNMGPAAAMGLIVFLRGFRADSVVGPHLWNEGSAEDVHPADIVRGYLVAAVVRGLKFSGAAQWAAAIERETDADVTGIKLAGSTVTKADAKASAAIVARAIAETPMATLEGARLADIQNWRDGDEAIVASLERSLSSGVRVPVPGAFATHVVAAAICASLRGTVLPTVVMPRMIVELKAMHDLNPSWGPLFVRHPGDIRRHVLHSPAPTQ